MPGVDERRPDGGAHRARMQDSDACHQALDPAKTCDTGRDGRGRRLTEIVIARPRAEVAAFAADPDNATAWYHNIKAVEWKTEPPLAVGSLTAFVAEFLGRRLDLHLRGARARPGERFVMSTAEGPFPMETTYAWEDAAAGARG